MNGQNLARGLLGHGVAGTHYRIFFCAHPDFVVFDHDEDALA